MAAKSKVLWVVNYDRLDDFYAKAIDVGATAVAIRSDNNLATAIAKFHGAGLKVYGWRWPSSQTDACMKEAAKIADLFGNYGLDGYFVDPEGAPGKPYDWDRPGLAGLAADFMNTLRAAGPDLRLGVTSHYLAKFCFPNIPWSAFFERADVYLPQSYWRSTEGIIGHGDPADNYNVGIDRWKKTGAAVAKIVPMGGELGSTTAKDLNAYVAAANAQSIGELHFYASESAVKQTVWDAVKSA
ncbi:hypothetical protein [Rhizobium lusitanum]|uniref:Uncharacterized protein n=1 Tax=Rhizobium lusitanum TaxID=293958 RepID=A0A7X0IV29_9HYPH|nr:hypothetical protein [Rhizobium lusitanum]MBB6487743.1 hypothetical protein [Rhizobium lusitanum]